MHRIHSRRFDLNLLKTLAVLLEERQVSRAAARLNLTQSAVSHALQRLRDQFDDPLLVRQGQVMVPTPRAEHLQNDVDGVLTAIDRMVGPVEFEPQAARGIVRIATTDYGSSIILPHVVRALADAAPKLTVAYSDLSEHTFEQLSSGFIDLALSGQESHGGMQSETLFTERFVIMVRRDHPCRTDPMTLDDYTRWPHVVVDLVHSRLLGLDRRLKRLGRARTIAVRVPHFLAAPFLAQHSDLLVPVPERMAPFYSSLLGLRRLEPPTEVDIGRFDYVQLWDARRSADPVHRWLRSQVRQAVAHLN